jgi:hypothetical protein
MGESVESKTIHGHKDRGRETGTLIKLHPMGVVVIGKITGHGVLNSSPTLHPSFYTTCSVQEESLPKP